MILKVMQDPTVVSDASELAQQMANDFKNLLQSYYQRALDAGWVKIGEVKKSWRPAYYDQDEEGNMIDEEDDESLDDAEFDEDAIFDEKEMLIDDDSFDDEM